MGPVVTFSSAGAAMSAIVHLQLWGSWTKGKESLMSGQSRPSAGVNRIRFKGSGRVSALSQPLWRGPPGTRRNMEPKAGHFHEGAQKNRASRRTPYSTRFSQPAEPAATAAYMELTAAHLET